MDKLINLFIKEPEREFHVREISKLIEKSPTTTSKYLKNHEQDKILISRKKLGHLLFKANNESQEYKQLKKYLNIKSLYQSGLIKELIEQYNYPKAIILFGSFAKAENNSNSDIDLLIISNLKKKINLEKYEKILGHKIQLFVHSKEKIKKTNKHLINNWINGECLEGFWEYET